MFDPTITVFLVWGLGGLLSFAISQRLGYGLGFGLLMFVPILNLVGVLLMATTHSPNEKELHRLRVAGGSLGMQAAEAASRDYFRQLAENAKVTPLSEILNPVEGIS